MKTKLFAFKWAGQYRIVEATVTKETRTKYHVLAGNNDQKTLFGGYAYLQSVCDKSEYSAFDDLESACAWIIESQKDEIAAQCKAVCHAVTSLKTIEIILSDFMED